MGRAIPQEAWAGLAGALADDARMTCPHAGAGSVPQRPTRNHFRGPGRPIPGPARDRTWKPRQPDSRHTPDEVLRDEAHPGQPVGWIGSDLGVLGPPPRAPATGTFLFEQRSFLDSMSDQ